MEFVEQHGRVVVDGSLAVGGVASIWWEPLLEHAGQGLVFALGVALGAGRCYMVYLEWCDRRERRRREGLS